jgi:hypothetical protein
LGLKRGVFLMAGTRRVFLFDEVAVVWLAVETPLPIIAT